MKNLVIFCYIIIACSNSVRATEVNSNICAGEFSPATLIVREVNECSESEINQNYLKILELEDHVKRDQIYLQKLKEQSGRNKVSYNQVVFVETHYLTMAWLSLGSGVISGLGYVMHGLTEGGKLFPNSSKIFKGSVITLILSELSHIAAKEEKSRLEIEFKDIPLLEKSITAMRSEIQLRKKAIEIALKIKSFKSK
ncbi:MAG: hypothetical protein L6Q37_14340 [Bdellovibrionaceae bacterium]|nr:hypothetical protein [Pseudobdellovibrionaceae bacterium]NUM57173.1 hypothetical protein [Pseudobdellovibrionaceae bacterium]